VVPARYLALATRGSVAKMDCFKMFLDGRESL
jgi:hypothetical protein